MSRRSRGGGGPVRIEGARAILEAIRAGRRVVHRVTLSEAAASRGLRDLEAAARSAGVPVMRRAGPDRAVADADPLPEGSFEALLAGDLQADPAPPGGRLLVALDRVTDVGNLGSIARSALCAGASGLVLEHRRSPPLEPGAVRASAGALEHLPVGRTPSLPRALDLARAEGLGILVADLRGTRVECLARDRIQGDLIWVFGSEERGIRGSVRDRADACVTVPMAVPLGSLGVAAAAAYLLLRTAEARRALARPGLLG